MSAVFINYIEDYIEFIAGYRDINNRKLVMFDQVPSPLSLARYDVKIVDSLGSQTAEKNIAYTDKQAELAKKIVNKYRKQLSQLPVPLLVPENFDKFCMPIRTVDRSKRAYINDQKLYLKFPYNTDLITSIKNQLKQGDGNGIFDNDTKIWQLSITESTVNWICTIAEKYEIELDNELKNLLTIEDKLTRSLGFFKDPLAKQQAMAQLQSVRSRINRIEKEIGRAHV